MQSLVVGDLRYYTTGVGCVALAFLYTHCLTIGLSVTLLRCLPNYGVGAMSRAWRCLGLEFLPDPSPRGQACLCPMISKGTKGNDLCGYCFLSQQCLMCELCKGNRICFLVPQVSASVMSPVK